MNDLTLAHSGDPDDVYMWWPLTGVVGPDGTPAPEELGEPAIDTGRWRFRAVPGDIAEFNRLAAGAAPYDITALSVRAFADVAERYVLTRVGSSFGESYGPKVVVREERRELGRAEDVARKGLKIAVPGLRTSACLTLRLLMGERGEGVELVERAFDAIIPAVVRGEVDAGLVIHEGQVAFAQAGLREVVDLGRWWGETRGLPLPLGVNAVKRDLDQRFGAGSVAEVAGLLERSLACAQANHGRAIDATMPFAVVNAQTSGLPTPSRALVEKYVGMYVTPRTVDMGEVGQAAIARLLGEGAAAGLCPRVDPALLKPA